MNSNHPSAGHEHRISHTKSIAVGLLSLFAVTALALGMAMAWTGNTHTSDITALEAAPAVDVAKTSIANVLATDITQADATITWVTDQPSTSQVEYGPGPSYGSTSTPNTALTTDHVVTLTDLTPVTLYHYRVKSTNGSGSETMSPDNTFTTVLPALKVHFIDVGEGNAILLDCGDTEVLIDGGDRSPGIVQYLSDHVDGALEAMIATHPHTDSIGGLIAVLAYFDVQEIWHNGDTGFSETYEEFMTAVEAEGADVHIARRGDNISAGELKLTVLNPATLSGTLNDNSIVLSLTHGVIDFLFGADAQYEAAIAMTEAGMCPNVDVLQVGHHGTASYLPFLTATQPAIAIYLAGTSTPYCYPHTDTIAALHNIGASIYGTDVHGTIIVTTNGTTCHIELTNSPPSL